MSLVKWMGGCLAVCGIALTLWIESYVEPSDAPGHPLADEPCLVFVHIPKTAGSSIEELGLKHGVRWGKYHDYSGYTRADINKTANPNCKCVKWHWPDNLVHKSNKPKFCVVRDPYERVISEYHYRMRLADSLEERSPENFKVWLRKQMRKLKKNPFISGCHFVPQSDYIFYNGRQRIEHILYLDGDSEGRSLEAQLGDLCKHYGIDIPAGELPKANASERRFSKHEIDTETEAMIYKLFQQDFERLGYSRLRF